MVFLGNYQIIILKSQIIIINMDLNPVLCAKLYHFNQEKVTTLT